MKLEMKATNLVLFLPFSKSLSHFLWLMPNANQGKNGSLQCSPICKQNLKRYWNRILNWSIVPPLSSCVIFCIQWHINTTNAYTLNITFDLLIMLDQALDKYSNLWDPSLSIVACYTFKIIVKCKTHPTNWPINIYVIYMQVTTFFLNL
jgi:hypothetical protein